MHLINHLIALNHTWNQTFHSNSFQSFPSYNKEIWTSKLQCASTLHSMTLHHPIAHLFWTLCGKLSSLPSLRPLESHISTVSYSTQALLAASLSGCWFQSHIWIQKQTDSNQSTTYRHMESAKKLCLIALNHINNCT